MFIELNYGRILRSCSLKITQKACSLSLIGNESRCRAGAGKITADDRDILVISANVDDYRASST
jgi:hypothetical protein